MDPKMRKFTRAMKRRRMRDTVMVAPDGTELPYPTAGRIKKNKGSKLRRLREIANGKQAGVLRAGAEAKAREEKLKRKQKARKKK